MHETDALDEDAAAHTGRSTSALRAELTMWVGALAVGMAILGLERLAVWIVHRPPADLGGTFGGLALALLYGLRFDASAFLEGKLRYGLMEFKPDDSSHAGYRGPTGDVDISYRPLARLRIQADYKRDIVFSIFGDNLFFLQERYGLEASVPVSHRFRLSTGAARSTFDYPEAVSSPDLSGLREDQVDEIWIGWSYALPGRPRVGFRVVRWDRDSNFEPAVTSQYLVVGEARYEF